MDPQKVSRLINHLCLAISFVRLLDNKMPKPTTRSSKPTKAEKISMGKRAGLSFPVRRVGNTLRLHCTPVLSKSTKRAKIPRVSVHAQVAAAAILQEFAEELAESAAAYHDSLRGVGARHKQQHGRRLANLHLVGAIATDEADWISLFKILNFKLGHHRLDDATQNKSDMRKRLRTRFVPPDQRYKEWQLKKKANKQKREKAAAQRKKDREARTED